MYRHISAFDACYLKADYCVHQNHESGILKLNKIKELAENDEHRQAFCNFLYEDYCTRSAPPVLQDFSFYPIREILIDILGVATEKKDFRSAFLIIFCTQMIGLINPQPGGEIKRLSEYFYTQAAIRNRSFWGAAVGIYRAVISCLI